LRFEVPLKKEYGNLPEDCDILIDQIKVIDNKRLQKKIRTLPDEIENLNQIVFSNHILNIGRYQKSLLA
jgi:mRNA-degrading endonuclease toxin of MazEF toxin-antitoxin module